MFDSVLVRHGLEQGLLGSAKMLDEPPPQTLKGDSLPEYCPEDFNGSVPSNLDMARTLNKLKHDSIQKHPRFLERRVP